MTGPPPPDQWQPESDVSPNGRIVWFGDTAPIEPKFVERPLLQAATFHLFAGKLGVGKGALVIRWIARCTNGLMYGTPRNALLLASEEDAARDIVPRIEAAGGDAMKVAKIPNTFLLPRDIEWLRELVEQIGDVGLIALDPLSNHIGGTNSNADEEVRNALQPLALLAGEVDVPTLGVRHISSKEARGGFVSRILGSTAWPAVPRVVLGVGKDEEGLLHVRAVKGNRLRDEEAGMRFRLEGVSYRDWDETVVKAVEDGASTVDIDSLMENRRDSKSEKARQAIVRQLRAAGGQMESDVLDAGVAAEVGVAARTARNMRMDLRDRGWVRMFPEREGDAISRWMVALTNAAPFDSEIATNDPEVLARARAGDRPKEVSSSFLQKPIEDLTLLDSTAPTVPLPDSGPSVPTCPTCGSTDVGAISGRCRDCGERVNPIDVGD